MREARDECPGVVDGPEAGKEPKDQRPENDQTGQGGRHSARSRECSWEGDVRQSKEV